MGCEGGGKGRQVMDWQPIETAPKDGRKILLIELYEDHVEGGVVGEWRAGAFLSGGPRWVFIDKRGNGAGLWFKPTHWAPIYFP